jgi:hypothetical protein
MMLPEALFREAEKRRNFVRSRWSFDVLGVEEYKI